MEAHPPSELHTLLAARTSFGRQRAWTRFLETHSPLILHTVRSLGGDEDAAMDRYAFVVEQLRKDDCRRLRGYVDDGRTRFTTWLVVVVRRLALDLHRQRYGRPRSGERGDPGRRRLVDLSGEDLRLAELPDRSGADPEIVTRQRELGGAMRAAMENLDVSDRLLIALRFEDGCSAAEIARVLDFPSPFHVYRRLNHLLKTLRERLEERGIRSATP